MAACESAVPGLSVWEPEGVGIAGVVVVDGPGVGRPKGAVVRDDDGVEG